MQEDLIRFVTDGRHHPYGHRTGIFTSAFDLQERQSLPPAAHEELCELLAWLEKNLAIPSRFAGSRRPHAETSGISWIRAVAQDHVKKLQRLVELVRASGTSVHKLRTTRPGYILYEDAHQVVALPFADTPS